MYQIPWRACYNINSWTSSSEFPDEVSLHRIFKALNKMWIIFEGIIFVVYFVLIYQEIDQNNVSSFLLPLCKIMQFGHVLCSGLSGYLQNKLSYCVCGLNSRPVLSKVGSPDQPHR